MKLPRRRAHRLLLAIGATALGLALIGSFVADPPATTPAAGGAGSSPSWTVQPSGNSGPLNDPPPPTTVRPVVPPAPKPKPKPTATRKTTPPPPRNDPRYDTCKQAKAHGYGPYYRGKDPEYNWYIDADNDGIVCE